MEFRIERLTTLLDQANSEINRIRDNQQKQSFLIGELEVQRDNYKKAYEKLEPNISNVVEMSKRRSVDNVEAEYHRFKNQSERLEEKLIMLNDDRKNIEK